MLPHRPDRQAPLPPVFPRDSQVQEDSPAVVVEEEEGVGEAIAYWGKYILV